MGGTAQPSTHPRTSEGPSHDSGHGSAVAGGSPSSQPACDKVSARSTQPWRQREKTHLWGWGLCPRSGKHLQSPATGAWLLNAAGGSSASTFIPSFSLALARPAVGTATLALVWGGGGLGRRHSTANAGHQGTRALTSALNKPKMEISAPVALPGLDGAWEAGVPRGDRLGRANHGVSLRPGRGGLAAFAAPSEEARATTGSLRGRPGVGGRLPTRAEPLERHPGLHSRSSVH